MVIHAAGGLEFLDRAALYHFFMCLFTDLMGFKAQNNPYSRKTIFSAIRGVIQKLNHWKGGDRRWDFEEVMFSAFDTSVGGFDLLNARVQTAEFVANTEAILTKLKKKQDCIDFFEGQWRLYQDSREMRM